MENIGSISQCGVGGGALGGRKCLRWFAGAPHNIAGQVALIGVATSHG